jgi:hypothetical protein
MSGKKIMTIVTGVCLGSVFLGCWRLPSDFPSLSLDKKVEAYAGLFKRGGARKSLADDLIAGHGYAAAEAMAPYVRGQGGIPPFVAINIVWDVQYRGCNLQNSSAERALRQLLQKGHPQVGERGAAQAALSPTSTAYPSIPREALGWCLVFVTVLGRPRPGWVARS